VVYGPELGASALAVDIAMRYLFSSVFPLFTVQLIDSIGFAWTMTACAMAMIALAPVPWVLWKKGPTWRRSRYIHRTPDMRGNRQTPAECSSPRDLGGLLKILEV
jgi:hypothetical protein